MFTGIIEQVAEVGTVARDGGSLVLDVETGFTDIEMGESIAVNGVCLTVVEFTGGGFAKFFVSEESIERTNLGALQAGSLINLERAVQASTRLSGHMVQGHVDGVAKLASKTPHEGAFLLEFSLDASLRRYCVEKGSVTLNGISLTINHLRDEGADRFIIGITIIPHTMEHTNLSAAKSGDAINVEVDVIAKYVERLCLPYQKP